MPYSLMLVTAIATSVGSKTLTMRQAILMASICEFSGASLMGAKVTGTISKGTNNEGKTRGGTNK